MHIQSIMSSPAVACKSSERCAAAAQLMWDHDCGFIPVVDDDGKLCGVVTDRDICMATLFQGRSPQDIPVADVMSKDVVWCRGADGIETAELVMSERQVRRLPITDSQHRPIGVLSMNDIVRHAADAAAGEQHDALDTLAAVSHPRFDSRGSQKQPDSQMH